MNPGVKACITVLALSLSVCVHAATSDELADIRRQMETLQKQYEARLKQLETRLEQAEALARQNQSELSEVKTAPPVAVAAPYTEPAAAGTPAAGNAFNPALSVVLQGSVNSYSENPDKYALPGFQLGDEGGLANQGLTLDETEVTASANVNPLFYGQTTLSLSDQSNGGTEISIEEAFVDPTMLPAELDGRFGRFYSDIGYLNRFHSHAWDFHDVPLAYRAFLNKQYGDDGVRLAWVAPTDTYLMIGGETFAGNNFPAGSSNRVFGDVQSLFVNVGGDVGVSNAWLAGVSGLRVRGMPIVVHHKSWAYLNQWLGLQEIGTLEPKPGVPPSSSHLAELLETLKATPAKAVIRAPYQDPRASEWLSKQVPGLVMIEMPFTVGGNAQATDLFGLFDSSIALLKGAQP